MQRVLHGILRFIPTQYLAHFINNSTRFFNDSTVALSLKSACKRYYCSLFDDTQLIMFKYTGSVTQGPATTTIANLFPSGIRTAGLGTITTIDASFIWSSNLL